MIVVIVCKGFHHPVLFHYNWTATNECKWKYIRLSWENINKRGVLKLIIFGLAVNMNYGFICRTDLLWNFMRLSLFSLF